MAIKLLNSQLNNETVEALNKLIDLDINASCAFKLTRVIREISSIVEDRISLEKKILEKYIEKDETGNPTKVLDSNGDVVEGAINVKEPDQFTKEMSELMNVEVSLNYDKIKFEELGLKTAKIKDLLKLEFLFD
jgi:myo-inositol-1-phosphate synthase